eukprot:scaffold3626_cov120-Skeletonema_marinoi.AAC.6
MRQLYPIGFLQLRLMSKNRAKSRVGLWHNLHLQQSSESDATLSQTTELQSARYNCTSSQLIALSFSIREAKGSSCIMLGWRVESKSCRCQRSRKLRMGCRGEPPDNIWQEYCCVS